MYTYIILLRLLPFSELTHAGINIVIASCSIPVIAIMVVILVVVVYKLHKKNRNSKQNGIET